MSLWLCFEYDRQPPQIAGAQKVEVDVGYLEPVDVLAPIDAQDLLLQSLEPAVDGDRRP